MAASQAFWTALAGQPAARACPTPFYLFSIAPVQARLDEFQRQFGLLGVRPWLSFKSQPLPSLVRWWRQGGRDIEVVSAFELQAALTEGFSAERILINGPAKHRWLPALARPGLRVHFDSAAEARALAPLARDLDWACGIRLLTRMEYDPQRPEFAAQFGLTPDEAHATIRLLKRARVRLESVHFHLRTNVGSAQVYARALAEAAATCRAAGFSPRHVDCGGGFPAPHILNRSGHPMDAAFHLEEMAEVLTRARRHDFPDVAEWWMENGRWLTSGSGALVVSVLDAKTRGNARVLVCDGGRTMNALMSNWEQHAIVTLPRRRGRTIMTALHGPTCMAFDQLARRPLPASLRPGDRIAWLDAGAYHLPWETRFSHGLAAILWHDGHTLTRTRDPESFAHWWSSWEPNPQS